MPANRRRQSTSLKQKAKTKKELEEEIERLKRKLDMRDKALEGLIQQLPAMAKALEDKNLAELQKINPNVKKENVKAMISLDDFTDIMKVVQEQFNRF